MAVVPGPARDPLAPAAWLRGALALAVALAILPACKPTARGLCSVTSDCRSGQLCAVDGICLAQSGTCQPACGDFEVCTAAVCQPLRPVVTIALAADGLVSPGHALITVEVDATRSIKLGALHVEAATDHVLAVADLAAARSGVNGVVLAGFEPGYQGPATLVATLQFTKTDGSIESVRSIAVPVTYDAVAPAVTSIFLPAGQGEQGGWLPGDGADLSVLAQVSDGTGGSGAATATLKFDVCPANAPCSYDGQSVPRASGDATFGFKVPRAAQTVGSEAPVAFTVTAADRAGNAATAAGSLPIDRKPPTLGTPRLVTAGTVGEDGNTWFAGGPGAAPVEIAVPLDDKGVGVDPASATLQLTAADVDQDPGPIAATFPTPADGAAHFLIPAATAVTSREGRVRFTVAAKDKFGQAAAAIAPAPAVFLDAAAPTVSPAQVDYAATTPAWSAVCGQAQSAGSFICGRGPSDGPTAILRDDTATITVDIADCGSGVALPTDAAVPALLLSTGGGGTTVILKTFTTLPSTCANGSTNPARRYTALVQAARDLPPLVPLDSSGVATLVLQPSAGDRLGNVGGSPVPGQSATVLSVSLVRWRRLLAAGSTAPAAGSPLLLPRPSASSIGRSVVVPVAVASPASNLISVRPDGSLAWGVALSPGPQGDVAAAPSGLLLAPTGVSHACGGNSCGTVWALPSPSGSGAPTPFALEVQDVVFGAPVAAHGLAGNAEVAFAVPTTRGTLAENVYAFKITGAVADPPVKATVLTGGLLGDTFRGVTAAPGNVFVNHSTGFSSTSFSGTAFGTNGVDLDPSVNVSGAAPPSVLVGGGGDVKADGPFFPASDGRVRRTDYSNSGSVCGALSAPCWQVDTSWAASGGQGASAPKHTPVFDKDQVVVSDGAGGVTAWRIATGALLWQLAAPSGPAASPASPPVLLKGPTGGSLSPALVVSGDGSVRRVQPPSSGTIANAATLVKVGSFDAAKVPPTPVVDSLGAGGVAYVADGLGWLWAVQLDDPPLQADATSTWPRPGRDSCNSRSAASTCP